MNTTKQVVIIGAGPAGLTAGLELLRQDPQLKVVILEALDDVGGISRTINHHGNRMDIGGHRFFSKNEWVMNWWTSLMPVTSKSDPEGISILDASEDKVMLVRPRLSRIYFLRKFFDYPIKLSLDTISKLGLWRTLKIGISYMAAVAFPKREEKNLEDFLHNRFGKALYQTFFRDYTEKVWGIPCHKISAEWGAQRIKGLSISRAISHALKKWFTKNTGNVAQKSTETSLIERFLYPKYGPGQMWNTAAIEFRKLGGELHLGETVAEIHLQADGKRILEIVSKNIDGNTRSWKTDYLISSMPIKDLIAACQPQPDTSITTVAKNLVYRDFITIGLKLTRLKKTTSSTGALNLLPDTWIYIQESGVKLGRLQVFNNWSPALVQDKDTVWLGLEYFCQENDSLWVMTDEEFSQFAIRELESIDLIDSNDVVDFHVEKIPKAYPAYFGSYDNIDIIQKWNEEISNLFMIGRNGLHRYNNQDHSMLTAKIAATAIAENSDILHRKQQIWLVNAEQEYQEEVNKKT